MLSGGGSNVDPEHQLSFDLALNFKDTTHRDRITVKPINYPVKILERFRNVFKLSYQRYIDIAQAEAQAREAKIEAALEKVRSRSSAMYKSEELQDVINSVFMRLKLLQKSHVNAVPTVLLTDQHGHAGLCLWIPSRK